VAGVDPRRVVHRAEDAFSESSIREVEAAGIVVPPEPPGKPPVKVIGA
jgi:hypothetical protein